MWVIGFDPGGVGAFGWAVLSGSGPDWRVEATGTCANAREAVQVSASCISEPPTAIGVDAPLYWVLDGDRRADQFVRKMVCAAGGRPGTVGHVNALRGACLVQGAQAVRIARMRWPKVRITEAHPKALLRTTASARIFVESNHTRFCNSHERDALAAAYAAVAYQNGEPNWRDLAVLDIDPFFPAGAAVAYWFPNEVTSQPERLRKRTAHRRSNASLGE